MMDDGLRVKAESGDAQSQYRYAFALADLPPAERSPALVAKWLRMAEQGGCEAARALIRSCGADADDARIYAEVRILLLQELERRKELERLEEVRRRMEEECRRAEELMRQRMATEVSYSF